MDIKPYLPFAESLPDASASYAQSAPAAEMAVSFTAEVEKQLLTLEKRYPQLTLFIHEVLAQDPRPAYRKGEETGKTYAVWLHDFNVPAGASPTQVLKSLRWNRVKFTPFSFDISFALVN